MDDIIMDEQLIEKVVDEESIYEGKIVHLHLMRVTLPSGKPGIREIVRHVNASAVVAVDENNNVLLVRQFRAPMGRVTCEIPAGKLDSPQEDPLEAARRELSEETGYQAEHWVKLTDMISSPGFCDEVISIFLATGLTRGVAHPDDDEFLGLVRMPFDEAIARAQAGEFQDSKTLCGLLLAQSKLEG